MIASSHWHDRIAIFGVGELTLVALRPEPTSYGTELYLGMAAFLPDGYEPNQAQFVRLDPHPDKQMAGYLVFAQIQRIRSKVDHSVIVPENVRSN
jgi:hypothetical protein